MGHRATIYKVKVREQGDTKSDLRVLGDFCEEGVSLGEAINGFMSEFEVLNQDGSKLVRCLSSSVDGDELRLMLQHGQTGVAAEIRDAAGDLRIHQDLEDGQFLRCGALFSMPATEKNGWLAVHVNNGRGIKGLLANGITRAFRVKYPELVMEIEPYVLGSVLTQAVADDLIERVKLVRYEQPQDRANAATNKWVPGNVVGRLELSISVPGKDRHIVGDLVRRYLGGETSVLHDIVVFEDVTFDEAHIEVDLPQGKRTFNIVSPEAGHALSQDIDVDLDGDGEPIPDSLFEALRDALTGV